MENDVKQGEGSSPTPLAEAIASSPEVKEEVQQVQEAQTPPAETEGATQEQEQQPEEGRIPYSRFKEKVDEANWLKQQLELRFQQERSQQQIQQPTQSPYAGMTPEEERFWRVVDERAGKIAEQKLQQVTPVIDAGRMELAQMKVQQFRNAHSDIKPDSPDEIAIAQRISNGYTPDDAYWAVMGPRGMRVAEEKGKQQVKQQIAAKKLANVENSTSVPIQSQPQGETLPFPKNAVEREAFSRQSREKFKADFWKNWKSAEEGKL